MGVVVNIITKSGSNDWVAGALTSFAPNAMRNKTKNINYEVLNKPGTALTDGKLFRLQEKNAKSETEMGAYVGGPIIKDKLFMFVAVDQKITKSGVVDLSTASVSASKWGWAEREDKTTRYLGKFDWNLHEDHRLELTLIGDNSTRDRKVSGFDYATLTRKGPQASDFSDHYKNEFNQTPVGSDVQFLKYTGNLTNDLTLTAAFGLTKTEKVNTFAFGGTPGGSMYFVDANPAGRAPGIVYNNPQPLLFNQLPDGAVDKTKSFRLDAEYKLGQHSLRAGMDVNKLTSLNNGDFSPGGGILRYRRVTDITTDPAGVPGSISVGAGGGWGLQGYYGRQFDFATVTNAYSDTSAWYLEDKFQVTKNFMVAMGLRSESFQNLNNEKEVLLDQRNKIAPRMAATWDVNGDASLKVYGSMGRYSVQMPTHLAVRGAGPSTYMWQYFTYTGVNPDGSPIGRVNISPRYTPDGEDGSKKDRQTLLVDNLKPNTQDEISLGFEKALSKSFNIGGKLTYRKLGSTIDDFCGMGEHLQKYADAKGIDTSKWIGGANGPGALCVPFNPGEDATFNVDYAGTKSNYTKVTVSAKDIGFDKPKRNFFAFDVFAEHPLSNGWYGKVSYAYAKSEGNTEGQTQSDVGQTDIGETRSWDFADLMEHSYGKLPNNRTHSIKAYGFVQLNDRWQLGANALFASGRPRSCIGSYPTSPNSGYQSAYHYCDGVPSPRGSVGSLPSDKRLDVNVVFKPPVAKGLQLRLDLFNVLNTQTAQNVDETYNIGGPGSGVSPTYSRVISYTEPRYMKFTIQYDHKF